MKAPPAYTEARLRARFHVQVEYEAPRIVTTPTYVTVCGRVKSVFRGDNVLYAGDVIQFQVAVYSDGDLLPPSGTLWMNRRGIVKGRFLEAFLNGNPPTCTVAASQSKLISELSSSPQMDVPTEEQVAAEWTAFRRWV